MFWWTIGGSKWTLARVSPRFGTSTIRGCACRVWVLEVLLGDCRTLGGTKVETARGRKEEAVTVARGCRLNDATKGAPIKTKNVTEEERMRIMGEILNGKTNQRMKGAVVATGVRGDTMEKGATGNTEMIDDPEMDLLAILTETVRGTVVVRTHTILGVIKIVTGVVEASAKLHRVRNDTAALAATIGHLPPITAVDRTGEVIQGVKGSVGTVIVVEKTGRKAMELVADTGHAVAAMTEGILTTQTNEGKVGMEKGVQGTGDGIATVASRAQMDERSVTVAMTGKNGGTRGIGAIEKMNESR